jgi:hypothetical protein
VRELNFNRIMCQIIAAEMARTGGAIQLLELHPLKCTSASPLIHLYVFNSTGGYCNGHE